MEPKIRGHLVTIWWDLGPDTERMPFDSLSMEVEIAGEPGRALPLYVAPFGLMKLDGVAAYGGLQNVVDSRGETWRQIIFSRWGERRTDYLRTAPGGTFESAGYEGDFISVRSRLDWQPGRYRVAVERTGREQDRAWMRLVTCPVPVRVCQPAGELAFPSPAPKLSRSLAGFVEYYGPVAPDSIPPYKVTLAAPKLNGMIVPVRSVQIHMPAAMPPLAKTRLDGDGTVVIEIGLAKERQGKLLPSGKFYGETLQRP